MMMLKVVVVAALVVVVVVMAIMMPGLSIIRYAVDAISGQPHNDTTSQSLPMHAGRVKEQAKTS